MQFPHIVMVEVCKPPVPERPVQWTSAHSTCKVGEGHHLTIQEGSIVGVDCCSEQENSISVEEDPVLLDGKNVGFMTS